ncbi:transposase [Tepidanaerobacter acetatoxydans Re1]|uniref:Transposase n=1 Tax=Tepidanaerobacter acetatoxydans (strain DSM 21804 / JCM 16047 / Re1) TaxID=1209989 RepID=F4LQW1_TEPAE|nr:IS1634 family transposase [Tepidanaerobacter acetatoxydans]AEE91462.1 transposase IS4 family protein [Tepidanaerobacter acetatoxydans Re1]AEE92114.1 transposase IS4 family protein [Tepidanaerobacter acetatoxydans Re1]CDI40686.1 transposase [Tepidanaerobacter acetatoxydans Re1]CDI40900.1 transposase [Tepidanaerobacter acetatoxydans Re1]
MRLSISKSKNSTSLYVIESIYENGKHSTRVVEKLGTVKELEEKLNGQDPIEWAKEYIKELNKKEKEQKRDVIVKYSQSKRIEKGVQRSFNGGYLFLQQIYHQLGLHKICKDISTKYKFTYNLDSILSRLIYGRILFPSSKLNTYQESKCLIEQPDFELQHVYRALEVIAKETDFIQSELYKNSLSIFKRNDHVLYYDCTNYFFEIEQEDGFKQYGPSKENKPNPIVGMGLFMDGDGIPLAFNIHSGNTNEQITLKPLEEKILKDFELSKFIVCTDAGLSSIENRRFNDKKDRAFITTQSVKKLKRYLKQWALDPTGWHLPGVNKLYDISLLDKDEDNYEEYKSKTFYKERWIKEDGLEQKLIVTYSLKYRDYQRQIRNRQLERASKLIEERPKSVNKKNQNDFKRFISSTNVTKDGEIADKVIYSINQDAIAKEEMYDGFYAVCTNLDEDASIITKINHRRWEIEECFRIMKSEFKARPVYLSRDDRIQAHFTTCFLAIVIYRYLEKYLSEEFTSSEIIHSLRNMDFNYIPTEGYIPTYTRTDLTDILHEVFGFRTDTEIVSLREMKKILKDTKKKKILRKI